MDNGLLFHMTQSTSKVASLDFWGKICDVIFGLFSTQSFFIFEKCQMKFALFWPFGELDFLCRFGRFKDDFGRFLVTGRFVDTVSGHRMMNFVWKLWTRIYNFLFCLFHVFRFAVSGYSSAKPNGSWSSLMDWALFFLCIKCVHIAFPKRIWVF